MAIKAKNVLKKSIKVINKGIKVANHTHEDVMALKEKSENSYSYGDRVNDNGSQKINENAKMAANRTIEHINHQGFKSTIKTKENLSNLKIKIKDTKNILSEKNNIKKYTPKVNLKGKKPIKKQINNSIKEMRKKEKSIKKASKKAVDVVKKVASASSKAIKATIMALQSLIHLLIAGGWVVVVVIIVICLIAALCSSIFGIFFSGEVNDSMTVSTAVRNLNMELNNKIEEIKRNNIYDDYYIESNMASWKDILAIYAVKVSNGINENEVMTMNPEKEQILKQVFWDMNTITSELKLENGDKSLYKDPLNNGMKQILYITISGKTIDEMKQFYHFNYNQERQLIELLSEDYEKLWASVIYGTSIGSPDMVRIALEQVGNVGGEKFWSWYGFKSRVEWCAVFVSWVANEAGLIESGVIPKFASVRTGVSWFKMMNRYKDNNYIPTAGDIIFFDWENDGFPDHVGIVEKVDDSIVYTIEGNSTNDMCLQKQYNINNQVILGYGIF